MPVSTTYIAAAKFRKGALDYLAGLGENAEYDLVPEPDNQYDPHAVRVMHNGTHVGYVPRDLSEEVTALIREDRIVKAVRKPGSASGTGLHIHYSAPGETT